MGILALAAFVIVPLVREYADFRRSRGLGRLGSLGVTGLVVPAVGVGLVAAQPLASWPFVQWGATVAVALAAYSLAVRAVVGAIEPRRAPQQPR